MPKFSRVMASGSGPPRTPVSSASVAASCSAVSSKSKTPKFSAIRDGVTRLRDRLTVLLQVPAQHHLRGRLAVCGGDLADHRVLQSRAVGTVAVERYSADGRPGLVEDAVLAVKCEQLGLPEVGVDLDLVDRRHHLGLGQQPVEVRRRFRADLRGITSTVLRSCWPRCARSHTSRIY
jgi:hypothetical protein